MASIQRSKGRDFTAEELIGRTIRIEGSAPKRKCAPVGHDMMIIADDEMVANACKIELRIEPDSVVEAKITLYRHDLLDAPTETVTLRENIELSFSALVSEVC